MKVPLHRVRTADAPSTPEPTEQGAATKKLAVEPGLVPAQLRALPRGKPRAPEQRTGGLHVQMRAMIGQAAGLVERVDHALQAGLLDLQQSFDQLAHALFGPGLTPALVPVGVGGPVRAARTARTERVDPRGGIVMFASIRDMLRGHGRLQRECPGEYLDAEYSDVVKDAKAGNAKAKKAKKLAEQGNRLSGKLKGKK